jgi:signal transduction histidine kinase/CheY-like chemotaxis protein
MGVGWVFGSLGAEIIDRLPFGVYAADQRGVIRDANRAMLAMLGAGRIEDLGRRSLNEFRSRVGPVEPGKPVPEGTVGILGLDGVERTCDHIRLASDFLKAGPYQFGVVREVLAVPEGDALHAQRLASLGGLAGRVAHDLNNLLVAVLGHARLALDGDPHGAGRRPLEQIMEAAGRARELSHQLVQYAGRAPTELTEVDVNRLVADTVRLIEVSVPKRIRLRYDLADVTTMVQAYPIQLRQVVMNLVVNAAEAITVGEGVITVSTRRVEAAPLPLPGAPEQDRRPRGAYAVIEVRDSGQGMSEETRTRVFEPFFSSKGSGVGGLGLAAVADIVSAHRGAIEVESTHGVGSTFRVFLPAHVVAPDALLPEAPPRAPDQRAVEKTVLVVDDEELVRSLAQVALERAGFRVLHASSGQEAMQILERQATTVAAAIVDARLPDTDGSTLAREMVRRQPGLRVLLSSGYLQHQVDGAQDLHVAGFVQKPYTSDTLVAHVLRAISA